MLPRAYLVALEPAEEAQSQDDADQVRDEKSPELGPQVS